MTREVTTCDICGEEIENVKDEVIVFRGAINKYEYDYTIKDQGLKKYFIRKKKMDICKHCMEKFTIWLKEQESVQ